jgi:hypothetical protein
MQKLLTRGEVHHPILFHLGLVPFNKNKKRLSSDSIYLLDAKPLVNIGMAKNHRFRSSYRGI